MKKYLYLIKNSWIDKILYREEFLMSVLVDVLIFTGQYVFWHVVFGEREVVKGFSFEGIMTYYLLVRILSDIANSKVGFTISEAVREGRISNYLLRPFRIKSWLLIEEIGNISFNLIIKLIVYSISFMIIFSRLSFNLTTLPISIISMFFALILSFNVYFILGCLSFWTKNSKYINFAMRRVILFLSGAVIPITFFPEIFQNILKYMPFRYFLDVPIGIYLQSEISSRIFYEILIQVVWIIVLWLLGNLILSWSIKSNESVGI